MKKILSAFLLLCFVFSMVSCNSGSIKDYAELSPVRSFSIMGSDPDLIGFSSFHDYDIEKPLYDQIEWFYNKRPMKDYFTSGKGIVSNEWTPIIVTIVGYHEDYYPESDKVDLVYSKYYVLVESYGSSEIDNTVYEMLYIGTPSEPYYMRPTLRIGERYLRLYTSPYYKSQKLMEPSIMFELNECKGKYYVYGYGADLSGLDCAMLIKDTYENAIYKPDSDSTVLAFMEMNSIPIPTFDYKCELGAFIKEMTP